MLERHRLPRVAPGIQRSAAGVGVQEPLLVFSPDIVGLLSDVVEVGVEDEVLVPLLDSQSEPPLLLRQRPPREGL